MSTTREQSGRYQRSPNGMVGALLVLLLVIGAFLALRGFSRGNQDTPVPTVDYTEVVTAARAVDKLVVPAPPSLPEGWRATSARFTPGTAPTWHLGVLTDETTYVGVEEAVAEPVDLVQQYVGKGARSEGPVTVGGRTWQSWRTEEDHYALTLATRDTTVMVGGAPATDVRELAGSLEAPRLPGA